MNAFDALMYVFLFSVVSKMSHSELNFPCPVTLKQPRHYSDISAVQSVMMGTKLQCSTDQCHPLRFRQSGRRLGYDYLWEIGTHSRIQNREGRKINLNISLLVPNPILALACFN